MKPAFATRLLIATVLAAAAAVIWLSTRRGPAPKSVIPPDTGSPGRVASSATPADTAPNAGASAQPLFQNEKIYAERVKGMRTTAAALSVDDEKACFARLLAPVESSTQNRKYEYWERNVMLDKLVEAPTQSVQLPGVLIALHRDQNQDLVMRDYAIQHMAPAYDRASADDQKRLRDELWEATQETDSSIAGTALLALHDLAQRHPDIDGKRVAQTVLNLAGDTRCGELARITAIQLCGRMGITDAASFVEDLARSANSVPLRLSAVAALGDLGGASAQPFLREIAAGSDDRLRPAAESALKRLSRRLGP